jgi:hypothetical protein
MMPRPVPVCLVDTKSGRADPGSGVCPDPSRTLRTMRRSLGRLPRATPFWSARRVSLPACRGHPSRQPAPGPRTLPGRPGGGGSRRAAARLRAPRRPGPRRAGCLRPAGRRSLRRRLEGLQHGPLLRGPDAASRRRRHSGPARLRQPRRRQPDHEAPLPAAERPPLRRRQPRDHRAPRLRRRDPRPELPRPSRRRRLVRGLPAGGSGALRDRSAPYLPRRPPRTCRVCPLQRRGSAQQGIRLLGARPRACARGGAPRRSLDRLPGQSPGPTRSRDGRQGRDARLRRPRPHRRGRPSRSRRRALGAHRGRPDGPRPGGRRPGGASPRRSRNPDWTPKAVCSRRAW